MEIQKLNIEFDVFYWWNFGLGEHAPAIQRAYDVFALAGPALENDKDFHVGASKILHWLAPELFIMVDQNVARAFRRCHDVASRNSTQPGYNAAKYVQCLTCAQSQTFSPLNLEPR